MKLQNAKINMNFSADNIQSVRLLGVTNQCIDFKLHALLNYQENIYANVYSFLVTYKNGQSETIQTYDETEITFLSSLIKNDVSSNNSDSISHNINPLDELEKLKKLFDSGVIPESVFNEKKDELLSIYSSSSYMNNPNTSPDSEGKIVFCRKRQSLGSAVKSSIYVDGVEKCKLDSGKSVSINVSNGLHTITIKQWSFKEYSSSINMEGKDITVAYKLSLKNTIVLDS